MAASTTAAWASWCRWSVCANCSAPAGACPSASKWWRSPKRRASATRPPFSARARLAGSLVPHGSGRLMGQFDPAWLAQQDADGITLRSDMQQAGLCVADIARLQRDPARYLGFVEVHIEQGPVLG